MFSEIKPCVNLNGSTKESLLEQKSKEIWKVVKLIEVLAENRPHPRDYQSGGNFVQDGKEQESRIKILEEMLATMRKEQEWIADF